MERTIRHRILSAITLLAPGLYAGRLLSEWLLPGLAPAAILTIVTTIVAAVVLRRRFPDRVLWPALPLLAYVPYPFYYPRLALALGGIALVTTVFCAEQGLIKRWRPATGVWALMVFLGSFTLYLTTIVPGLLPADNGELQVAAAQLGVAHPPGFALYTLLAHLATRIPLGPTDAFRVNLLSTLIAAATLSLVFLSAVRLARSHAAALVAVFALASATTFWSQATTANVRMLTALFAALGIYLLLRIRDDLAAPTERRIALATAGQTPARSLFLFALTLSLGITHHPSLIFMGLIFVLVLIWLDPAIVRRPSRWPAPVAGLLLGLVPLLYFPLRAAAPVRGASPDLATVSGFLEHVLALGFRGDLFAFGDPQELWARLQVMGNVMTFQFHGLLLAGMFLGFVLLLRRQPKMALALSGAFAIHTLVTATYRAPQTVEYMLPAYVPAALLLAGGAAMLRPGNSSSGAALRRLPPALPSLLIGLLLVVAISQGLQRYPSFGRLSNDHAARDYAAPIIEQAPDNAVILADWHWVTPLWYVQEVEGKRGDLDIRYVFPTAEPYGETWARRVAENMAQGRSVVTTHFDASAYEALQPPEPLAGAYLFRQEPRRQLPPAFQRLDETPHGQINVLGYQLQDKPFVPLEEAVVTVAWQPVSEAAPPNITLFLHLVNSSDGAIYAQQDVAVRPARAGITLTQLRVTPRLAAPPGEYFLYVGAYESAGGRPLLGTDGAARMLLQTTTLQAMRRAPYTAHHQHGPPVTGDKQLMGYDWDHTLAPQTRLYLHWETAEGFVTEVVDNPAPDLRLPPVHGPWGVLTRRQANPQGSTTQYYVPLGEGIVWTGAPQLAGMRPSPGEEIALTQDFVAARPLQQDLVVSVRLIGYEPDGVHWAWWDLQDSVPALGAIPTLKWIEGSRVRDPHYLTVSPGATSGQTLGALVTLYDAFTQRSWPILDERIIEQYLGIPLGLGQVR